MLIASQGRGKASEQKLPIASDLTGRMNSQTQAVHNLSRRVGSLGAPNERNRGLSLVFI
jgi:hypothetical protein